MLQVIQVYLQSTGGTELPKMSRKRKYKESIEQLHLPCEGVWVLVCV